MDLMTDSRATCAESRELLGSGDVGQRGCAAGAGLFDHVRSRMRLPAVRRRGSAGNPLLILIVRRGGDAEARTNGSHV